MFNISFQTALTYIGLILILATYVIVVIHILYSKHEEPSEILFWIMLVGALPIFGMVCYLLFGITNVKKVSLALSDIRAELDENQDRLYWDSVQKHEDAIRAFDIDSETAMLPHNYTFDRLFHNCIPTGGNNIEMLADGTSVYPKMIDDIKNAKIAIRLQSYILMYDSIGSKIIGALEEKAREGVDVKILFDSVGSFEFPFSLFFNHYLKNKIPNFEIRAFSLST